MRRAAALLAAAGLAVGVAACGSSKSGSSGGSKTSSAPKLSSSATKASGNPTKGTINWWASPITTSGPDVRKVWIAAFEKAYPGIKVHLISAPTDTDTNRATLTTQISGGSGPDVFMGDVIWPAQFGAHGLAVPLSKYLPKSYWSKFAPGLVQGATYKGQVYGAPLFEDQGFLYYRKDLLAKDHLPVPKTWEQLVSESKTMQSKHQVKYGYVFQGADYEGATCDFAEFLADAGGRVLNASDTKAELGAPAVKALSFERSLVAQGISPQGESTFQEPQSLSVFTNGQAAFLRNWDYAYASSNTKGSKVIGKVGVAPMPTFQGQSTPGYSNIGGWNLYINPHSKNIAADLTFIKWMTGRQAQTIQATKFSQIPTITSVRTDKSVIKGNANLLVVPHTRLVPRPAQTPNYSQVSQAIYQNVSSALAGQTSPKAAVSKMTSSINSALGGGL
ncbi:MAG TPA: ABC transporter substrate-binding protein [Solirubrobacteraceae bacterium]|nr:ABC transporter substrate-binding protein [Solirubrobacteraceae bacterium]